VTSGCTSDLAHATNVAQNMVRRFGMSKAIGPVYFDDNSSISTEKRLQIESETRKSVLDDFRNVIPLLMPFASGSSLRERSVS
jgi:ATP-dependent metalloprotease